ncbi:translocation/assembly module TamB domain-containing protein [Sphingobacterium corticis]|uniref:Translocation/assembly module TamB domain-containing protein n=1 Tax=Sphingobacterium corticis TaxID=1812823 RepID=A0ABW5NHR1_9SPHI
MLAIFTFSLQFAVVQTFVAKKATNYLSSELDAKVSLSGIYFHPFSALVVHDFTLDDPKGERLISSDRLYFSLSLGGLLQNRIRIKDVYLAEGYVNYVSYKDSSNFDFLIDYFSPKKKTTKPSKKKMEIALDRFEISNSKLLFTDATKKHHDRGIDYSKMELSELSGIFSDISLDTAYQHVSIKNLRFRERSGFELKNLSTSVSLQKKTMIFDDLELLTNRSKLTNFLRFDFDKLDDFGDFVKKVTINARLENAFIDSRDIAFFAPDVRFVQFQTAVQTALLSGTIAEITARNVSLTTKQQTALKGRFRIKGLPDIDKTIFDFSEVSLKSHPQDINVLVQELANDPKFKLPEQIESLGRLGFQGSFVGLYNDFDVDGAFQTELGDIKTNTSIEIGKELVYAGALTSPNFNLGAIAKNNIVGNAGLDLKFDGKNTDLSKLDIALEGTLTQLELQQNTLQKVQLQANLKEQILQTTGQISDPFAALTYDAQIDLSAQQPIYKLSANVDQLHLSALHFLKKDSIVARNVDLNAEFAGTDINNLSGFIETDAIALQTQDGLFQIEDFKFESAGDQTNRKLILQSNVLDAELIGTLDLNTIQAYFQSLAVQYAPAIGLEKQPFNDQNFDLKVALKSFDPVSSFLDLPLSLDDGALLNANFSSDNYIGNFNFSSPSLNYNGVKLHNLRIDEKTDAKNFSLRLLADRLSVADSIFVNKISVENILSNDSLHFAIKAAESDWPDRLRLNGHIHFEHNKPAYIHFEESNIVLNNDPWKIQAQKEIRVSKGKLYFDQFRFTRNQENVEFNGILSNEDDELQISFNRFGLQSLEAITNPLGIHLRGEMNGQVAIHSVLKSPYFKANIQTTPIVYNAIPIGQLNLDADFNPENKLVDIKVNLLDALHRGFELAGTYDLDDPENALQLRGEIREMELVLFQPFLKDLVSDLTGKSSAELKIGGTFQAPKISGQAQIQQASFTVLYLNTNYSLSDQAILFEDNVVRFANLRLNDAQRHEAASSGYLDLNQLSDPEIQVEARANNFMVLNTTYKENNTYYGTAFATGIFKFSGRTTNLNINIQASSNPNTVITIPLDAAMTISESDFIYMVQPEESKSVAQNKNFLQGLTMNMDITLTPDAEMNIHTDIGQLRGTGDGEVNLKLSNRGDFEMFGDYNIAAGKFHFVAQDFINKYFDIKQGGTIRWTGDPTQAQLDVTAIYQQRTALGALYNSAGRPQNDERVLAQADMIIGGTLGNPDISFDLSFPLTPYVKDELQAYLSDANNVNQQALSLIVRRSFTATNANNEFGREVNNTLLSAGTEFAFNQLNAIISQSLNVNFLDLNIRSLNDASASLRLFDDRLVLTGGISDRRNLQNTDLTFLSNRVATDAELTYRIRKDGSLMFRAYNRLNTRNMLFTPTDEYINAAGLIYRQEFNTFQEFFRRLITFKKKEEEKIELIVPIDSTATPISDKK